MAHECFQSTRERHNSLRPLLSDKLSVTINSYLLMNTFDPRFHRKTWDADAWSKVIDQTDRKAVNGLYVDGVNLPQCVVESLDTSVF